MNDTNNIQEAKKDVLVIPRSKDGALSYKIKDGLVSLVSVGVAVMTAGREAISYINSNASSFSDYVNNIQQYSFPEYAALATASVISCMFAPFAIKQFLDDFYLDKGELIINKTDKKLKSTDYSFPLSKSEGEYTFDKITGVEVIKNSIDAVLNVGTIDISCSVYNGKRYENNTFRLLAVKNPEEYKSKILEGLPEYEGLEVKLKQ